MDLITHGILDAILMVFLFMLGIITNGLRAAIRDSQEEQRKLSEAITQLSVTISREYVTRSEAAKDNDQIWCRLDQHTGQIGDLNTRVRKLEP